MIGRAPYIPLQIWVLQTFVRMADTMAIHKCKTGWMQRPGRPVYKGQLYHKTRGGGNIWAGAIPPICKNLSHNEGDMAISPFGNPEIAHPESAPEPSRGKKVNIVPIKSIYGKSALHPC